MDEPRPDTHQKALRLNLNSGQYGTLAEIGAGQEVARWLFHVGGASGTVAKTISAYDMAVSDAIYGHADRYVSRQRLQAMLSYEYDLLLQRLKQERGEKSTFFAFADTVAARRYGRHEDGHGWLGIRFQTRPGGEASEIILHAAMLDNENARQQEALGIVGINLIYGAFYHHHEPIVLIRSLLDGLTRDRIEVDMLRLSGPAFAGVENRLTSLQLVEQGFTEAAMFTADGEIVQPSEVLYKKPLLVLRGSFRPVTKLTLDLLRSAYERFLQEPELKGEKPLVLLEMTLRDLSSGGAIRHEDYLARVDILRALGQSVLISNHGRYFRLAEYLSRYTTSPIGIALDVPSLREVASDTHYSDLPGGALEATGRLFSHRVRSYVYPHRDPDSGELITAETLAVAPHLKHLYAHLLENHLVVPIRGYDPDCLGISTADVLARIQASDASWESLVPPEIVQIIKQGGLFGCRPTSGR